MTSGQGPDGDVLLASSRSQLEVLVRRSRVEIRDLSGQSGPGRPLSGYLRSLVNLVSGSVTSIGLNSQWNIPVTGEDTGGPFLSQRMLWVERISRGLDGEVVGFGGTINFRLPDGTAWNLTVEPSGKNPDSRQLFINLNHSIRAEPPLETPLPAEWEDATEESRRASEVILEQWLAGLESDD